MSSKNKFIKLLLLPALLFSAVFFSGTRAGAKDTTAFADFLFTKGEFTLALGEYYRALYFENPSLKNANILYKLALAHLNLGRHKQAELILEEIIETSGDANILANAHAALMKSYYAQERFGLSLREGLALMEYQSPLNEEAVSALAWSYIHTGRQADAAALASNEQISREIAKTASIGKKSPRRAALLSALLPGAGHIYASRPRDGIVSFLINGIFGYAIYESFKNDKPATGFILSVLELGWYTGNINSAAGAARRTNKERLRKQHNRIKDAGLKEPNITYELP